MRCQGLIAGAIVIAVAAPLLAQAPSPPARAVSVGQLQAMAPAERAIYLAGAGEGFAAAQGRPQEQSQQLATCMKGYDGKALDEAYRRQRLGGPVAKLGDEQPAAVQLLLAMIGECQIQGTR